MRAKLQEIRKKKKTTATTNIAYELYRDMNTTTTTSDVVIKTTRKTKTTTKQDIENMKVFRKIAGCTTRQKVTTERTNEADKLH